MKQLKTLMAVCAMVIATLSIQSAVAGASEIAPFAVKSVKFTAGEGVSAQTITYLQSTIEGELLKQGMIAKADGVMIEATAVLLKGDSVSKTDALRVTARAFNADKIAYSIAVQSGGKYTPLPTKAMNDEKFLVDEVAKLFSAELAKQVVAQRQTLSLIATTARGVPASMKPKQ